MGNLASCCVQRRPRATDRSWSISDAVGKLGTGKSARKLARAERIKKTRLPRPRSSRQTGLLARHRFGGRVGWPCRSSGPPTCYGLPPRWLVQLDSTCSPPFKNMVGRSFARVPTRRDERSYGKGLSRRGIANRLLHYSCPKSPRQEKTRQAKARQGKTRRAKTRREKPAGGTARQAAER